MTTIVERVERYGIRWGLEVADWRDFNVQVGAMLVEAGLAEERYTAGMIANVEKNGPYLVIAPGVALLHARPEDGATGNGVVVATTRTPVEFGHSANDPVWLALGLTATGDLEHVELLQGVALLLAQDGALDRLKSAGSDGEFRAVFRELDAPSG